MSRKTIAALALLVPSLLAAAEGPATLRQCHQWAEARVEDLKIRREDVVQSRARARAALGSALPQIDWNFSDTWQDPAGVDKLEAKGFSGFVEKEQVESKFSLRQPLFSGMREFSARAGFQRESARDALRLQRAALELFGAAAEAFYAVLAQESERENTAAALALAQDRVKELKDFKRLGKARDSELFTAQAHAAALNARLQQIDARAASAREDLSYLTGQDLAARPLQDEGPGAPDPGPLDAALAKAKERADLKAQREEVAARKLRVRYEKGSYWPKADVTGNYYTERPAFMNELAWDVMLTLRVPLYQGGAVSARTREAESAVRQAELMLEHQERSIAHAVRKLHKDLSSAAGELRSLEDAAQAAQRSYDALQKEYTLGLTTNLEVLQALDMALEQKRARDASRIRAKLLSVQLALAVEALP